MTVKFVMCPAELLGDRVYRLGFGVQSSGPKALLLLPQALLGVSDFVVLPGVKMSISSFG